MAALKEGFESHEQDEVPKSVSRPALIIVSILLLAAVAAAFLIYRSRGSRVERGTRGLVEAFSTRRLIEPRLSGGFKCGAYDSDHREPPPALERERELILDAVSNREPGSDLAYARLLLSAGKKDPDAITHLRLALALSPDSPEAHNDLGVCLFQQEKIEDAIGEFETALKHRPDMPEALFNHALCYEHLLLRDAAADAYKRFEEIESDSGWRNEGRRRHEGVSSPLASQKLEADIIASFNEVIAGKGLADGVKGLEEFGLEKARQIADQNLQVMIKYASERLPAEYLKHFVEGRPQEAQQTLFAIELIGERLAGAKQDSSIADLGRYLRNLPPAELPAELTLVTGYAEAGKLAYRSPSAAREPFELLRTRFAIRGNVVFEFFSIQYL